MKHWVIGLLLIAWAVSAYAKEEYRTFSDAKDRTISAKITDCDWGKNKVTLELKEGKRRAIIPIDSLSKEDQAYVKEWYTANEALSAKKLRIECKNVSLKKWKNDDIDDTTTTDGESYSGALQEIIEYEQIAFDITLQNKGKAAVEHLRIEYKIYYEQSETTTKNPDPKQLVLNGTLKIKALKPKEKVDLQTDYVQIREEEITLDPGLIYDNPPTGAEGEVYGMRARIYLTLSNGEEAMREFCEPSALSEKRFPWEKPKEDKEKKE